MQDLGEKLKITIISILRELDYMKTRIGRAELEVIKRQ